MSVGRTVVEVIRLNDRVYVATKERSAPREKPVAVYLERTEDAEWIMPGDTLEWMGGSALWTPQTGERHHVPIPKIGYSGVPRPGQEDSCPA